MSLRKKIQKSMIIVIATTLIVAYVMTIFVIYRQNVRLMEEEARQEAEYIITAVTISGAAYLEEMDHVSENTRVTLIDSKGNVIYDSRQDDVTFENHLDRPEIREALVSGSGQDIRESDTLDTEMFYYAERLHDDTILRVSKTMNTALHTAIEILPGMGVIAAVMLVFAYFLSRWQSRRIIRPVNELDIGHPLDNEVYEELTPLLESIDEQNKAKDAIANMRKEFSANVSHELKTPLTSISGYAEIMKNGLVKPEDMGTFSERIYSEASRLITLVEDIIELSRLDEGGAGLEREEVDLYLLTREIVSRLAPQAQAGNIHMEVSGEPVKYFGVRRILDEMVYNVCENAVKYNKPGGSVSVWVGGTLGGKKIIVTDTGIGIPEDQKERIFERFYRVDKSHSRKTGGTGLGLSIVKHGAILHGAQIHVESALGEGTKIEMVF